VSSDQLPPLLVSGRIEAVRELLGPAGCDALVITDPINIRWCTGFTGSVATLVVSAAGATLVVDSRYRDQAPTQLAESKCDADVEVSQHALQTAAARLEGVQRVGLEADSVTWDQHGRWSEKLAVAPVATTTIVMGLRAIKTDAELSRIEVAAQVVDSSLADAATLIAPGVTEREIALAIDDGIRSSGATGPAYDTIVATGTNSALPHATPGDRLLRSGDLLVVDAGALVDGYRSDMTRTFVVGDEPTEPLAREILELVSRAQRTGVDCVAPGVRAGDVDLACRTIIDSAGFAENFGHGTGHGVGLGIHELPAVRKGNAAILQQGHVLTVEPGIYLAGIGGVRIEDTVVVTPAGHRVLTRFPKQTNP